MFIIYKLTRDDGKIYIGQTLKSRFRLRMNEHKHHKRFLDHKFNKEIIYECLTIEEALYKEKYYIRYFNSYNEGLNYTEDGSGNHKCKNFTTLGFKFSEKSKLKMRESGRKKIFTDEWKNNLSKSLKGKPSWNKGKSYGIKLSNEKVKEIKDLYNKKENIIGVGDKQKNGRVMSYEQAFSKKYAQNYNVTPQCINNIIKNKIRKYV